MFTTGAASVADGRAKWAALSERDKIDYKKRASIARLVAEERPSELARYVEKLDEVDKAVPAGPLGISIAGGNFALHP